MKVQLNKTLLSLSFLATEALFDFYSTSFSFICIFSNKKIPKIFFCNWMGCRGTIFIKAHGHNVKHVLARVVWYTLCRTAIPPLTYFTTTVENFVGSWLGSQSSFFCLWKCIGLLTTLHNKSLPPEVTILSIQRFFWLQFSGSHQAIVMWIEMLKFSVRPKSCIH